MNSIRYFKFIVAFILVSVIGCNNDSANKIPEFDLMLPDSTVFSTADIPLGMKKVIIYYDGECDDCHEEVKDIVAHMDKLKETKFYLVTMEPLSEIIRFKNHLNLNHISNIIVARDTAKFLPRYLNTRSTPNMILLNKDNMMMGRMGGKAPVDTLLKYLNRI